MLIADGGKNGAGTYSHGWGGGGGGGGYISVVTTEPLGETYVGSISVEGGNAYTAGDYLTPTNRYSTWDHRGYTGVIYTHTPKGLQLLVR